MRQNLPSLLFPQPTDLWLGDAEGQETAELEAGYSPFWLDEQTYGYIRLGRNGRSEVVTADVETNDPRVMVTIDELHGDLPGPGNPGTAWIAQVQPNPAAPSQLLITILDKDPALTQLFLMNVPENDTKDIAALYTQNGIIQSAYTPDGRYLVSEQLAYETGQHRLLLFENAGIVRETFFLNAAYEEIFTLNSVNNVANYDWTADSQWLLVNYPGFLKVVSPERDFQTIIPHPFGSCERVEWVQ
jgi:hypothetical protein